MMRYRYLAPAALVLILAGVPASAQTADEHDAHHAPAQAAEQPQVSVPAQPGMMGRGMMGGQGMMGMMRGGMMQGPGMGMIDRVEGRLAFLKTELKITEAQTPAWNAFAETLRVNAKTLGEVRSAMMTRDSAQKPQTVTERLDLEERWLASRLEGTRATKAALVKLYGVLSAAQKETADELVAPHVGIAPMMMGMGGGL